MAHETILIVDADPKSQKVLEVTFLKKAYRVVVTETLAEAFQRLDHERPDLIISETQLPDGDGFEFCARLQQDDVLRTIPFVFMIDAQDTQSRVKGLEAGAAEVLTKPLYIRDVAYRVEVLLATHSASILDGTEGDTVEGSLKDATMVDLLQMIEHEQKSGTINLERDGLLAGIYFKQGDIIDAICGKLQGEEAIYRLMLWPRGRFTIRYHDLDRSVDHVPKNSTELLIEGMLRLDKWTKMVATLPNLKRVFEADYDKMGEVMREYPKEVGQLIRLFDGERTLRSVADNSPLDDLTTLRILRKCLNDNLIVDITPEGAELTDTAQHTNLAAWLTEHTTTTELPDLDEVTPASQAPQPEVEDEADLEPGVAPEVDPKAWRFHWDNETQQAVALPREEDLEDQDEDVFEIEQLEQDLETLEMKRREEEARRIEAERIEAQAIASVPQTIADRKAAQGDAPQKDDFQYVSKDDTKELHRRSILDAIDSRHELERQRSATPLASPAMSISTAEAGPEDLSGDDAFDPMDEVADMLPEPSSPEPVVDEVVTDTLPLIPLGGPEDMASEPIVKEADLPEVETHEEDAQELEEAETLDTTRDEEQDTLEEDSDEEWEEDDDEEWEDEDDEDDEESGDTLAAVSQRNARDKELVNASYDLKPSKNPPSEEAQQDDVAGDDDTNVAAAAAATAVVAAATTTPPKEEVAPKTPVAAEPLKAAPATEPSSKPLVDDFSDLEPPPAQSAFNTKGLLIVSAVVIVLLVTLWLALRPTPAVAPTTPPVDPVAKVDPPTPEETPVATQEPAAVVAVAPDASGDTQGDAAPDAALADAKADTKADDEADAQVDLKPDTSAVTTSDSGDAVKLAVGSTPDPDTSKPATVVKPEPPKLKPFKQRLAQARSLTKRERYKAAKRLLTTLQKEEPRNGEVSYLIGRSEYNLGNDAAALRAFGKARSRGYRNPGLFFDMASLHTASGNNAKAIKAYQDFLKFYPTHRNAASARKFIERLR